MDFLTKLCVRLGERNLDVNNVNIFLLVHFFQEKELSEVAEKNTELAVANSDLRQQLDEMEQV